MIERFLRPSVAAVAAFDREASRHEVIRRLHPMARHEFWRWSLIWPFVVPWFISLSYGLVVGEAEPDGTPVEKILTWIACAIVFGGGTLYLTLLPLLRTRWVANSAVLVTSDRILRLNSSRAGYVRIEPINLLEVQDIDREERDDGSGSLVLHLCDWLDMPETPDEPSGWKRTSIRLEHLPDSRLLEDLIEELQVRRSAIGGPPPALREGA
jgi:hypothetical protein